VRERERAGGRERAYIFMHISYVYAYFIGFHRYLYVCTSIVKRTLYSAIRRERERERENEKEKERGKKYRERGKGSE